jgi:tetratricopeptide (TPR) repeat protein
VRDDWSWHRRALELREGGDLGAAEDIYVKVGEQPSNPRHASSATNSLVFGILIPGQRFVEARFWLQNSMDMEAGYESWNSLENLGVCEYAAGNNELAVRYLQQVVDANDGPVDAARELIEKINRGQFAPSVPQHDLDFNSEWQDFEISGPVNPNSTQREFYLRLIKYMADNNQEFGEDSFIQSSGACVTGFANGIVTGQLLELGLTRDAAAKACYDYVHYVLFGNDPEEDPFQAGLALWNSNKKRDALRKLRIAARQGNPDAILLVARGVEELFSSSLALPWYRLALAHGKAEAEESIEEIENGFEEDNGEYNEDENHDSLQTSAPAGPKFCTNCGTAREGQSKFCTNCGVAFEL